ncbi:MAG: ABC-2 family transporter protein [Chloroflexi bacterium]|nr:ABC-2 family transporter protein [Chloroflexota bacterium]
MSQLRLTTTKYAAITLTNLQNQLAYVWEALNRAVFIVLIMFVFVQLWTAVYESQGVTEIAGLSLSATIWYLLIAETLELGKMRHDERISEEVKDGSVAYTLTRPYNYLAYHFFNGLGETAVKMFFIFLLGLPLVVYYAGWPTLSPAHALPVLLVGVLAVLLDFFAFSMIGLLAFVTEDTASFRLIYQKLVFILGGLMLPLDFLPDWLQPIARVLPFNLTTYAPAKLFVAFTWAQFWQIIALQIIWLSIFGLALWRQYRWAIRQLVVNGG